jgi:cytochrome c
MTVHARRSARFACAALLLAVSAASMASEVDDRVAAANLKRGQLFFMQCRTCHDLEAGVPPKVGPNLNGVIGRKAGGAAGFKYSEVLARSGIVWTTDTLDAWIRQPAALAPGNAMAYPGIANDADRAAVIAWMIANGAQPVAKP